MPKIKTYAFEELSEDAQSRVIDRYREVLAQWGHDWHDEAIGSAEAFLSDVAPGAKLKDWLYDSFQYDFNLTLENDHFRGRKLKSIKREAMPTGYYLDCVLYQTLHKVWKQTGNPKRAIIDAVYAAFDSMVKDYAYQLSDEAIKEHLSGSGDVYFEDGTVFKY